MRGFSSLKFKPHPLAVECPSHADCFGVRATANFKNGYGVSVLRGSAFYSNGVDTYEVAILKHGSLCYDTYITNDVLGHRTESEVSDVMRQVQSLPLVA